MQSDGWRISVKRALDRLAFRLGHYSRLNYKNYQLPSTYNRGDHSIIVATEQQLKHLAIKRNIVRVTWENLGAIHLSKKDKVLICGSGYLFPNEHGELPKRLFDDLVLIEKSGCELHFLGAGFNSLLDWDKASTASLSTRSSELMTALMNRAVTLTVRDENTQRFLGKYTERNVEVIGDPALFITAPHYRPFLQQRSQRPKVGVNIPFHGKEPTLWIQKHLTLFIRTLKRLEATTHCQFIYFIHYDSEILVAELIRDQGISIEITNKEAVDLPAEYAKLDLHIGGMLHSCIIATAANTPTIGLAYDEKHFGFFKLMGRSEYCMIANNFDPDELLRKCLTLLDDVNEERSKIASRKQDLELSFCKVLHAVITEEV